MARIAKEDDVRRRTLSAAEICRERKSPYVTVLDVRGHTPFLDYFVVCESQNRVQSEAIVSALREKLPGAHHREGREGAEWILLDYSDFAVHVMLPDARRFYDLERLWGDAPRLEAEGEGNAVP